MFAGYHRALGAAFLLQLLMGGPSVLAQSSRPWVDPPANLPAPRSEDAPADEAPPPAENPAPIPQAPSTRPSVPAPPAIARRPLQEHGELLEAPVPQTPSTRPSVAAPPALARRPLQEPGERLEAPVPQAPSTRPSVAAPSTIARRPLQEPGERLEAREKAAEELARRYLDFWSAPNEVALETTPDFYAGRVAFHGRMLSLGALLDEKRRFVQRWPERRYRHRPGTVHVDCEPTGESCTVRSMFDFDAASPKRRKHAQGTASLELVMNFEGGRPVIASESSLVRRRGRSRVNNPLEGSDG